MNLCEMDKNDKLLKWQKKTYYVKRKQNKSHLQEAHSGR